MRDPQILQHLSIEWGRTTVFGRKIEQALRIPMDPIDHILCLYIIYIYIYTHIYVEDHSRIIIAYFSNQSIHQYIELLKSINSSVFWTSKKFFRNSSLLKSVPRTLYAIPYYNGSTLDAADALAREGKMDEAVQLLFAGPRSLEVTWLRQGPWAIGHRSTRLVNVDSLRTGNQLEIGHVQ